MPLAIGVFVSDDARAAGAWEPAGTLKSARAGQTATVLEDQRVLVVGGRRPDMPTTTVELFDPSSQTSAYAEPLSEARAEHTATLLDDGRVLVAGGSYDDLEDALASVEIYDPAIGTWSQAAPMHDARWDHTAVRLLDGRVLVIGGRGVPDAFFATVNSAEIYDPVLDEWSEADSMSQRRELHAATLLPDGRVVVTGGFQESGNKVGIVEIFAPQTNSFERAGQLDLPRFDHAVTSLPDGRLLIAGGRADNGGEPPYVQAVEIYDPSTGVSQAAPQMGSAHYDLEAFPLDDGRVLIAASHSEVFDPTELDGHPWKYAGTMQDARARFAAVQLADGRAFVIGGSVGGEPLASVEVWDPRGVSLEQLGFPCTGVDECASGFCADGVCCDAACDRGSCDVCAYEPYDPMNGTCTTMSCASYPYVVDEASCSTSAPACKTSCTSSADCNPGFTCDLATQRCEEERPSAGGGDPPPDPVEDPEPVDSCSCSVAGEGRGSWLSALVPLFVLRRHRRAGRTRPRIAGE